MSYGPTTNTRVIRFVGTNSRRVYVETTGYKTPRPHVVQTPYSLWSVVSDDPSLDGPNSWAAPALWNSPAIQEARNKALERFILEYQGGITANLGLAAAEAKSSIELIASRLSTLYKGFSAIKRLDFKTAAASFGPPGPRKKAKGLKYRARDSASLHLEYIFGWLPLMSDVYTTYDNLMSGRSDNTRFQGSAKASRSWSAPAPTSGFGWFGSLDVEAKCRVEATVRIGSNTLADANKYGLINPVNVAWQAMPFSFVADWFLPISDGLSTLTDHAGYVITDPRETLHVRTSGKEYYWTPPPWGPSSSGGVVAGYSFTRRLVLPLRHYPLRFKTNPLNTGKAISVVSLLAALGLGR